MKAISTRVLKNTITYYHATGETSGLDDAPVYEAAVIINKVYVQTPKKNSLTSLGEQANDNLQVWFDCMNSRPDGYSAKTFNFYKDDKIVYIGNSYLIREAQCFPNPDIRHHWELRLT